MYVRVKHLKVSAVKNKYYIKKLQGYKSRELRSSGLQRSECW